MSEPEPNLTDFPRDGPGFDNLADPLDERDRETGFVVGIDHVQIAVPANSEKACRDFYLGVLGLVEIDRPRGGAGRSFLWARLGSQQLHFRPDPDFKAARFAHPGLLVVDVEALAAHLARAGYEVVRDEAVDANRFHVRDPFGNRLEFIEA
jgi:catechol 2,3-dioxygenase-like lactoylglutathione lyase family enzyme